MSPHRRGVGGVPVLKIQRTKTYGKETPTKKQQTFSITAPGATSVKLVGSFTHWEKNPIHLREEPDGVWRCYH